MVPVHHRRLAAGGALLLIVLCATALPARAAKGEPGGQQRSVVLKSCRVHCR